MTDMKRTLRHSGRISQLCTNYNLTVFLCTFMYNTCSYNKTIHINAFPGGVTVKNLSAMQETRVRFLGWEYPLEKEMGKTPIYM